MAPAHFPEGQGTEFAGLVHTVGPDVSGVSPGDAVIGFSDTRNAQADYVALPADHVLPKPPQLDWGAAANLPIAAGTATTMIRAVHLAAGDTVVIAGGAGGAGAVAVQLARLRGARVIATASEPNHPALQAFGAEPVPYGEGLETRIRDAAPDGVIDFPAGKRLGIKTDGMYQLDDIRSALAEAAELAAQGRLEIPIKARFSLDGFKTPTGRSTNVADWARWSWTCSRPRPL